MQKILNLSTTAIIRISGALAQLFLMMSVVWFLSDSISGAFFFGYSLLMITSAFARLGSEMSGLRLVSAAVEVADADRLRKVVASRVYVSAFVSVLLAIGLFSGLSVLGSLQIEILGLFSRTSLLVSCAAIPPLAILGLMTEILKGVGRHNIAIALQNILVPLTCSVVISVINLFYEVDLLQSLYAILTSAIISLISATIIWIKWIRTWPPARAGGMCCMFPSDDVLAIFREARSLTLVSSTSILMQWSGSAILGFMGSPEHVAGYSVAIRLSVVVSIAHSAIMSVFAPRMAAAHAAMDFDRLRRTIQQTSLIIVLVSTPVLLVLFVFGTYFMSFFHQAEYASVLRLLIVGQFAASLIGHSGTALVMAGQYVAARTTSLFALVSMIVMMFALIPLIGYLGAAFGMVAGTACGHISAAILLRRELGFWSVPLTRKDLIEALDSSA